MSGLLYRIAAADETDIPDAFYDKVALWSEPDTWGCMVGFAMPNDLVLVVDIHDGGYAKILWQGSVGFLHVDYLKRCK